MMHDDLRPLLDDAVYHALDASAGLKAGERSKLHKACKEDVAGTLLDNTVAAAFGHQFTLSLAEGSRFDPLKRGLALAAAGRSATSSSSLSDVTDEVNRDTHTRLLRSQWQEMLSAFAKDQELSGTIVSRLWNGVTFVMRTRAARAATWNVAEVSTACRTQATVSPPTAPPSPPPSRWPRPPTLTRKRPASSTRLTLSSSSRSGGSMFCCARPSTKRRQLPRSSSY